MIADHLTPKANEGGVAYTMSNRDHKGVMIVVISEDNRKPDGELSSRELLRSGCVQRHVDNGE